MKSPITLLSLFIFFLTACVKSPPFDLNNSNDPVEVVFLDIAESCGWNLMIADQSMIFNHDSTRQDFFLYSNIDDFNTNGQFAIGDTISIEMMVISEVPEDYPPFFFLCNRHTGIPVKVLEVFE